MKTALSSLVELQKLELLSSTPAPAATLETLRKQIPADILAFYERFRVRGRKAVAVVRNGVCGECHLRIPMGTLVDLMHGEIRNCGNCGRLLHLPQDTVVTLSASSSAASETKTPAVRRKRKKVETPAAQAA